MARRLWGTRFRPGRPSTASGCTSAPRRAKVRAYSAADGAQAWEQTVKGGIYGNLRVAGGKLLAVVSGGDFVLAALSLENGSLVWSYKDPA